MHTFDPVTITRKTKESLIRSTIKGGKRNPELKKGIDTTIHFLSHMIEQWAWRSCLNLACDVKLDEFVLKHVIAEDCGQCFGQTLLDVVNQLIEKDGINASGWGEGFIDDAAARVRLSFEYRSGFFVNEGNVAVPEVVEDMLSTDLWNFLDGIAQGARCTIQVELLSGKDPHHIWEAVFRAFGEATRSALSPCSWRQGQTVGVAGIIEISKD